LSGARSRISQERGVKTRLKASWIGSWVYVMEDDAIMRTAAIAILMVASLGSPCPMRAADTAPPALRKLAIVPEAASVDEGAGAVFVAVATYSNGARKNVTDK